MSGFLQRLIDRSHGAEPGPRPRRRSLFEPPAGLGPLTGPAIPLDVLPAEVPLSTEVPVVRPARAPSALEPERPDDRLRPDKKAAHPPRKQAPKPSRPDPRPARPVAPATVVLDAAPSPNTRPSRTGTPPPARSDDPAATEAWRAEPPGPGPSSTPRVEESRRPNAPAPTSPPRSPAVAAPPPPTARLEPRRSLPALSAPSLGDASPPPAPESEPPRRSGGPRGPAAPPVESLRHSPPAEPAPTGPEPRTQRRAPVARAGPRRKNAASPTPPPEPGPTVHVSIGRVEVRAVRAEPPAARPRRAARPAPLVSLDDYLKASS